LSCGYFKNEGRIEARRELTRLDLPLYVCGEPRHYLCIGVDGFCILLIALAKLPNTTSKLPSCCFSCLLKPISSSWHT
jgi:hypothetical protein